MQANISINMNNAAFQPRPRMELRRILLQVCETLGDDEFGIDVGSTAGDQISLLDINGNGVGHLKILEGNNGTKLYQDPANQPNAW
jgi:glutathione synthase/RimK-type ligase-like ATP-grasp enzyme